MVRVDLNDDVTSFRLPPGAVAQVAVYSDHWQPIAVVRRILLRMKSWMNYVIWASICESNGQQPYELLGESIEGLATSSAISTHAA